MAQLPKNITKFFWGDDLTDLSLIKHKPYITRTLLDRGDHSALHWLFGKISRSEAKQSLSPKMRKKSLNFWQTYLS